MEDKGTKEIQQNANSTSALETQLISALKKQLIEQTRQLEEIGMYDLFTLEPTQCKPSTSHKLVRRRKSHFPLLKTVILLTVV